MKVLLLNANPVVQKLIEVTTQKIECTLTTLSSVAELVDALRSQTFDLIVVDDAFLNEQKPDISAVLRNFKTVLLYSQEMDKNLFSYQIKKPFLPNDFLNVLLQVRRQVGEETGQNQANEDLDTLLDGLKDIKSANQGEQEETQDTSQENHQEVNFKEIDSEEMDSQEKNSQEADLHIEESNQLAERKHQEDGFDEDENRMCGGVLDLGEIEKIKHLLYDAQHTQKLPTQGDNLSLLSQLLKSKDSDSLRNVLDGMQVTINISFPNKDQK